jgi:hypothetical protein
VRSAPAIAYSTAFVASPSSLSTSSAATCSMRRRPTGNTSASPPAASSARAVSTLSSGGASSAEYSPGTRPSRVSSSLPLFHRVALASRTKRSSTGVLK